MQSLGVGGVERQIFQLADHFTRRGHDVSIAALHVLDPNWTWLQGSGSAPVQVLFGETPNHPLTAGTQLIQAVLKLRHLIEQENIQVVYAPQWAISWAIAWSATRKLSDTKLVWGVRGASSITKTYHSSWKIALSSRLCKWVSASVPLTISNSEAVRAAFQAQGYRCQKNIIIHNGIDADKFRPDPDAGARVRAEWGILENEDLVGLVGRLDPVKGHPTFLKAAALLANERENLRFVCVGEGTEPYRRQLQQLSQELDLTGRLVWAGARHDMPAVYSALDVACSPSYSEGFNNAIAEAMACGVPCVVTDAADPVKITGDTGIVVPPGDPHRLAEGLKTMLQKRHTMRISQLREQIVTRFGVETMVEATEQALSEVCGGAGGST